MFLSSILVGTVEKSVSLNLVNIILKVGVIWITCSRSLELDYCHCLIGGSDKRSSSKVREASNLFYTSYLLSNRILE